MQVAMPRTCRIANSTMQIIKKLKLTLLSFYERFLNLNDNIGISYTSNHENRHTTVTTTSG